MAEGKFELPAGYVDDGGFARDETSRSLLTTVANSLVPREYNEIELSPASKPTSVKFKKSGTLIRTLTITYEGATENIEKVVAS